MEKTYTASDIYLVNSSSVITDFDQLVLTRLYLPLISANAYALYLLLKVESNAELSGVKKLEYILQTLDFSLADLDAARTKLEGIGLLKTYINPKSNKRVLFCLFAPLKPDIFFANPLYTELLKIKLSEDDYQLVYSEFRVKKLTNINKYQSISAQFLDAFGSSSTFANQLELPKNIFISDQQIDVPNYDIDGLKRICNCVEKSAFTDQVITAISRLGVFNKIDIADMKPYVYGSYDSKKKAINIDKLTKSIVQEKIYSKSASTNQDHYHLHPLEFLTIKNRGVAPTRAEEKEINLLIANSGLPLVVINVIVDYVLTNYNNRLSSGLLGKIAGSCLRNGIDTKEKAIKTLFHVAEPVEINQTDIDKLLTEINTPVVTSSNTNELSEDELLRSILGDMYEES